MTRFMRVAAFAVTLLTVSGFTECYKPVTKSQMPPHIKTVAVPAFQNNALRFKIEHRFTEAVMNELIRRGHGLRARDRLLAGQGHRCRAPQHEGRPRTAHGWLLG